MEHLTFSLIHPQDITIIQQMVQGTQLSGMPFNRQSMPIFVARSAGDIVGFTCGQKGYGDHAHELTICGTYLYNRYNDAQHHNELQLAFVSWAENSLGVTHYKLNDFEDAKPIGISHIIPPQKIEMPPLEEDVHPTITSPIIHEEYAPH